MCDSIFSFPVLRRELRNTSRYNITNIYASALHPDGIEDSEEKNQQNPTRYVYYTNNKSLSQKVLGFFPATGSSLFLRHRCYK